MNGVERIAAERKRQIEEEGWTEDHDYEHIHNEMACAAACYALPIAAREITTSSWYRTIFDHLWPWAKKWWSPTPENRIRELEKAGALIAAEIDRLLRLEVRG